MDTISGGREEGMPIYIDCHQNPKKQSWMTNGCPNSGSDGANVFSFTPVVILFPLPWCDLTIRRNCNMQMSDDMSIGRFINGYFVWHIKQSRPFASQEVI